MMKYKFNIFSKYIHINTLQYKKKYIFQNFINVSNRMAKFIELHKNRSIDKTPTSKTSHFRPTSLFANFENVHTHIHTSHTLYMKNDIVRAS